MSSNLMSLAVDASFCLVNFFVVDDFCLAGTLTVVDLALVELAFLLVEVVTASLGWALEAVFGLVKLSCFGGGLFGTAELFFGSV